MGIKGLNKLISDSAPAASKEAPLSSLNGRKIAIDASMQIYQFLIAVRQGGEGGVFQQLTNEAGETTSHIQGMFNRTVRLITEGVKPCYVFDGKPPGMKSGELLKRREKRVKAETELAAAKSAGDVESQNQQEKRLVKAGTKENEDCKKLLRLMGCPVVEAPCEAEAQCASLAKEGKVYAAATEDMDCMTFGTPFLLRKMTFAGSKDAPIQILDYSKTVAGLGLTHDEFVDLCILLGCDYCDTIRGIGPVTALKLIREHSSIERILQSIDRSKFKVPASWVPGEAAPEGKDGKEDEPPADDEEEDEDEKEMKAAAAAAAAADGDADFGPAASTSSSSSSSSSAAAAKADTPKKSAPSSPSAKAPTPLAAPPSSSKAPEPSSSSSSSSSSVAAAASSSSSANSVEPIYVGARRLFNSHEVLKGDAVTLKWSECDAPGLKSFLVGECGFNPDRVDMQIGKLKAAYKANAKPQQRLDSFFTAKPAAPLTAEEIAKKRKEAEKNAKGAKGGPAAKKSKK